MADEVQALQIQEVDTQQQLEAFREQNHLVYWAKCTF